jgi:predicted nucleotidyltransferase
MSLEPADAQQLDDVLALLRHVLGPTLVGAYLHGSAARGGLRPRSDLDVLAVSREPLTQAQRRSLVDGLLAVSGPPRRPVELTTIAETHLRPWRYPPRRDFQYGEWLRGGLEDGAEPPQATGDPDLALLVHMALLADTPLVGPRPAQVFEPVPPGDLRRALASCVADVLRGLESDTTNMILTLARVWTSTATGAIRSKDDAAAWALERLPDEHRAVLAHARAVYLGGDERWDELRAGIRPHAGHVVGEIEKLT